MATTSYSEADSAQRRERAAIAAQACQTCRNRYMWDPHRLRGLTLTGKHRKTKCDEERPKCSLCRKLNVECIYREPLPTKKDKTMVHILDTLTRLETKFDNLALSNGASTPDTNASGPQTAMSRSTTGFRSANNHSEPDDDAPEASHGEQHLTPPHKIMLWPSVYIYLVNSGVDAANDLQYVLQEGTRWFIKLDMASNEGKLDPELSLRSVPVASSHGQAIPGRVAFPDLSVRRIQECTDAYFDTFNIIWPVLDRDTFLTDTVPAAVRSGYAYGNASSVIALLVLSLGQVAVEGVFERPIRLFNGLPSGLRGGTARAPPGLDIFNEARRRTGFISTQMTLETVQIYLLQATYFATTANHHDFWHSIIMASMVCQLLIKCQDIDWQSHYGGMVKRVYWTCNLGETFYHLDLDLPPSSIRHLEDSVPLPYFREGQDGSKLDSALSDERSHFQYHFLAMIALRRLITRIHEVIHESFASQSESADDYRGPPVIREMARQLESWRSLLPRPLQWQDSDRFDFPNVGTAFRRPNENLFSPDQGSVPIGHKYNLDLVTAQLRSRFYYARYLMYRPFVYKALHFPELMTSEDVECCALAIKSAILWPIAMAPPKNKKRLVLDQFAWSQNFIGILLILRMTTESDCLRRICNDHVNREDMQQTVTLMLEWIRDVSQIDAVAAWGLKILEPLYEYNSG